MGGGGRKKVLAILKGGTASFHSSKGGGGGLPVIYDQSPLPVIYDQSLSRGHTCPRLRQIAGIDIKNRHVGHTMKEKTPIFLQGTTTWFAVSATRPRGPPSSRVVTTSGPASGTGRPRRTEGIRNEPGV